MRKRLQSEWRAQGRVILWSLLPDPVPGCEEDQGSDSEGEKGTERRGPKGRQESGFTPKNQGAVGHTSANDPERPCHLELGQKQLPSAKIRKMMASVERIWMRCDMLAPWLQRQIWASPHP